MNTPLFETFTDATLDRVRETYTQRGTEYGDSWRNAQWLNMKAVCKKFGIHIPDDFLMVVAVAVLCDVKYNRLEGGYKDDTIVDSIAYYGLLAEAMRRAASDQASRESSFPRMDMIDELKTYNGGVSKTAIMPELATALTGAGNNGRSHV